MIDFMMMCDVLAGLRLACGLELLQACQLAA